jgi:hypothetical protein
MNKLSVPNRSSYETNIPHCGTLELDHYDKLYLYEVLARLKCAPLILYVIQYAYVFVAIQLSHAESHAPEGCTLEVIHLPVYVRVYVRVLMLSFIRANKGGARGERKSLGGRQGKNREYLGADGKCHAGCKLLLQRHLHLTTALGVGLTCTQWLESCCGSPKSKRDREE